jgi:hypothetical protein
LEEEHLLPELNIHHHSASSAPVITLIKQFSIPRPALKKIGGKHNKSRQRRNTKKKLKKMRSSQRKQNKKRRSRK